MIIIKKQVKQKRKKRYKKNTRLILSLILVFGICFLFYSISARMSCNSDKDMINENVLSLKPKIEIEMKKRNIGNSHLSYILAMVMQESKGEGLDPFQASESKCVKINCISNRDESVEAGIKAYKSRIKRIKKAGLQETPELVLQSYNYGPGYIDYLVKNNEKGYTIENALAFSKKHCGTAGTTIETAVNEDSLACYGDYKYVEHVERFLKCKLN